MKFKCGLVVEFALFSFHCSKFSIHIGVKPESDELCKANNLGTYFAIKNWIWGHVVEPYGLCLDYYGLGPICLILIPRYK